MQNKMNSDLEEILKCLKLSGALPSTSSSSSSSRPTRGSSAAAVQGPSHVPLASTVDVLSGHSQWQSRSSPRGTSSTTTPRENIPFSVFNTTQISHTGTRPATTSSSSSSNTPANGNQVTAADSSQPPCTLASPDDLDTML
uniref:Uncharacterized protein n=1 Tax=Panagrolaimus superbus TaxID=310955 RepID=A0A914Y2D8_9BILA